MEREIEARGDLTYHCSQDNTLSRDLFLVISKRGQTQAGPEFSREPESVLAGEQQSGAEVPKCSQFISSHAPQDGAVQQHPLWSPPLCQLTSLPPSDTHPTFCGSVPEARGGRTGEGGGVCGAYPVLCDLSLPAHQGSQCRISPEGQSEGPGLGQERGRWERRGVPAALLVLPGLYPQIL